jgi:hypothetical protein
MSAMPKKSNTVETTVTYPVRFYFMAPGDSSIRRRYPRTYLVYGADLKGNRFNDHCLGYVLTKARWGYWEAHATKKDGGFSTRNVSLLLGPNPTVAPTREEAAKDLFLHLRRHASGKKLLLAAGVL